MGVFYFTNSSVQINKVVDVLTTRGHKDIQTLSRKDYTLVYAEKILTKECNCILYNNSTSDFVIGVGIFFYDGLTGEKALNKVYENIETLLLNNYIYGHYAFCVRKDGITYILNDMSGMIRLYYYLEGNSIIISTSMLAVISSIKHPKFDNVKLATYLMGKDLPFIDGVELFHSYYALVITGENIEWNEKVLPDVNKYESQREAIDYVKSLFEDQIKQMKPIRDERINIELTGGLDSRLVASILKNAGLKYDFVHFPGLNHTDRAIAQKIANGLNKSLELQDDSSKLTPDKFELYYGEFDFCFNYFNHHANARRKMKNRYQFTGGRGEVLDTPHLYSTKSRMIEDLVYNVEILGSRNLFNCKMRKRVKEYLVNLYSSYKYNTKNRLNDKELTDFTETINATIGDSRTISAYNAIATRYGMFSEWHFRHFVTNISYEVKSDRKLTLTLISEIDPELGSYPFLSHVRSEGKSVNDAAKRPFHYKKRKNLKDFLPDFLLDLYRKKYRMTFDKNLLSNIDFDIYKNIVNIKCIRKYPGVYKNTLERLYSVEVLRKLLEIKL